jgi:hypothetical protein
MARRIRLDRVIAILFILLLPVLIFYNLEINPRPWHDEGAHCCWRARWQKMACMPCAILMGIRHLAPYKVSGRQ